MRFVPTVSSSSMVSVLVLWAAQAFAADPPAAAEPSAPPPSADGAASSPETASQIASEPAESETAAAPAESEPAKEAAAPTVTPPAPRQASDQAVPETSSDSPSGYREVEPASDPAARSEDRPATLLDHVGGGKVVGGFGGVNVLYTRFVGQDAVAVCGEGAAIFDHSLTLGGGGCGIATLIDGDRFGPSPHDPEDRLHFGYGGVIARYHFFSRRVVNVSVGALVGAGGVALAQWDSDDPMDPVIRRRHAQGVFVFEPQVGTYVNMTRWLRFGATLGYRMVAGAVLENLSNSDLSGVIAGGALQAGHF